MLWASIEGALPESDRQLCLAVGILKERLVNLGFAAEDFFSQEFVYQLMGVLSVDRDFDSKRLFEIAKLDYSSQADALTELSGPKQIEFANLKADEAYSSIKVKIDDFSKTMNSKLIKTPCVRDEEPKKALNKRKRAQLSVLAKEIVTKGEDLKNQIQKEVDKSN